MLTKAKFGMVIQILRTSFNWNFADPSWHCPKAENDLTIGGKYLARMEAKDGSFGFDFEAIYTNM
jgi:uncharacterized protein YndB with AHSA1/START domain